MAEQPQRSGLIGKAGEALVAAELLRRGVDVAYPAFDEGIDLIAYRMHGFRIIVPIQVKARSLSCYEFQRSWFEIPGVVLVQVWNLRTHPEFFIFNDLDQVIDALGPDHATSPSWLEKGGYSVTSPGNSDMSRMQLHRDKWERILDKLNAD